MKRRQLSYSILKKAVKHCFIEEEILTFIAFEKSLTPEEKTVFDYLMNKAEIERSNENLNGDSLGENDKD